MSFYYNCYLAKGKQETAQCEQAGTQRKRKGEKQKDRKKEKEREKEGREGGEGRKKERKKFRQRTNLNTSKSKSGWSRPVINSSSSLPAWTSQKKGIRDFTQQTSSCLVLCFLLPVRERETETKNTGRAERNEGDKIHSAGLYLHYLSSEQEVSRPGSASSTPWCLQIGCAVFQLGAMT